MPTCNQATYIRRAISSLIAQSYPEWELIIINDGCQDETEKYIKDYLPDNRIIYIKNPKNKGLGYALNQGLDRAKYEYIAYLPSDDYYYPEHWVKEFSQYDAGWLHCFDSRNSGNLLFATWDDLNIPARISVLAAAGLPMDEKMLKVKKEEFMNDMSEEIPLFSKGLYFLAREHKEGVLLSLRELEEFLCSVSADILPPCYLDSVRHFLIRTANREIEEEKSLFLLSKLPYSGWKQYWSPLLYNERDVVDEKTIEKEIDEIISDINYKRLGLHNGLAGLGMLLCP